MAGRKPPSNPGLWTLLLDRIGLAPAPKKGKKLKKRKAGARPGTTRLDASALGDPALDALVNAPIPTPPGQESPFAQYGQESGLGFADALGYEAAAAAGYAPTMPGAVPSIPFADAGPALAPTADVFSTPSLPFATDRFSLSASKPPTTSGTVVPFTPRESAPATQPAAPGKLFNEDALDRSLDALFSGLESGMSAPPPDLIDDRPAAAIATAPPAMVSVPVAPPAPPAPPLGTQPHAEDDRPKPPPPIMPDPHSLPAQPPPSHTPPSSTPPAPLMSKLGADPLQTSRREPSQLPAPTRLTLASGVDLKGLMGAVDRTPGVSGSMVVGYDGLIILSTLGAGSNADPHQTQDYLGALATSLFAGNAVQLEKMKRGQLQRLLLETDGGAMLMTAADMGILVVVSQDGHAMDVAAVLTTIAGALGLG